MLYTVAVVLLVLWILGFATSFTVGGLLYRAILICRVERLKSGFTMM